MSGEGALITCHTTKGNSAVYVYNKEAYYFNPAIKIYFSDDRTASLPAYSLSNRNGMLFYLRNFPAFEGITLRVFKFSPECNNINGL
ncbi:MAG: hypothetical protein ACYCT7_03855 [bacterium]